MQQENHNLPKGPALNLIEEEQPIQRGVVTVAPGNARPIGKMAIYFCGGTGVNIHKLVSAWTQGLGVDSGSADITSYIIDTSKSNMGNAGPTGNTFLFKDVDGFGKKRDEDPRAIKQKIPEILAKFVPQEINLVVSSASGGSGSVIAPLLTADLLREGKSVIVLAVVSTDSVLEIKNAIDTYGNYEAVANKTERPVVLASYFNGGATGGLGQGVVDGQMLNLVQMLSVLYSRRNDRLDQGDLRNWLDYNRVTSAPAKLVSLIVDVKPDGMSADNDLIPLSVATLAREGVETRAPWPVPYQAAGLVEAGLKVNLPPKQAVHFVVVDNDVQKLHTRLLEELKKAEAMQKSVTYAKPLTTSGGSALDDLF